MICRNCGKEISMIGNVCPYCHANKEEDRNYRVTTIIIGVFGGILGGGVGYLIALIKGGSHLIPMWIGALFGTLIFGITYIIKHEIKRMKKAKK
ncbi:MAG: hypothetical protein PHE26_12740 [Syntrophomonadaceae bacterium]|nr:hypothetical protein [Syntrophomonadaceae bacterium]